MGREDSESTWAPYDGGGTKTLKAEAEFIVSIELPALEVHQILRFAMRPADADRGGLVDRVTELVLELTVELEDSISVDTNGTAEKLEALRAQARQGLEDWRGRLKAADEGLIKVGIAKKQMNTMRESYYKELTQLREQVHLREKAQKAGKQYEADDFSIFDPADYCFGEEQDEVLKMKAAMLQQRFDMQKQLWIERLGELGEKVQTKTWLVERKDILLQALMAQQGYSNEQQLEKALHLQERLAQLESALKAQVGHSIKEEPQPICLPGSIVTEVKHGGASPSAAQGEKAGDSNATSSPTRGMSMTLARSVTRKLVGGGGLATAVRSITRSMRNGGVQVFCASCNLPMAVDARTCQQCGCSRDDAENTCQCGGDTASGSDPCRTCGLQRATAKPALSKTRTSGKLREKEGGGEGGGGLNLLSRARNMLTPRMLGRQGSVEPVEEERPPSTADCSTQSDLSGADAEKAVALLEEQRRSLNNLSPTSSRSESTKKGNDTPGAGGASAKASLAQPKSQAKSTPASNRRTAPSLSVPPAAMESRSPRHSAATADALPQVFEDLDDAASEAAATPTAATVRGGRWLQGDAAAEGVADILMRHGVPVKGQDVFVDDPATKPGRSSLPTRDRASTRSGTVAGRAKAVSVSVDTLDSGSMTAVTPMAVGGSKVLAATAAAASARAKYTTVTTNGLEASGNAFTETSFSTSAVKPAEPQRSHRRVTMGVGNKA